MKKTIVVNAEVSSPAPADLVALSLTVESRNTEYDKLMEEDSKASAALSQKLCAAGFPESELKTSSFRVSTRYRSEGAPPSAREVFDGYSCTHSYTLEFDFSGEALGRALDAAAQSGTNPVIRVEFGVKDRDSVRTRLLQDLASAALERAEILAIASGAKVGELVNITYGFSGDALPRVAAFSCDSAASARMPNFTPGDIEISACAQFTWELIR